MGFKLWTQSIKPNVYCSRNLEICIISHFSSTRVNVSSNIVVTRNAFQAYSSRYPCYMTRGYLGRFAHFPVRPRVVLPTFPFTPSRFALGSFRPLSRSPPPPRVVSPPYKILFLVLLFRPQKWYKALIFILIGDCSLYSQYFASVYRMSFCKTEQVYSILFEF